MHKIKIELLFAIICSIVIMLWAILEKYLGFQDYKIDQQMYFSLLLAFPLFVIIFFALKTKINKYYHGKISFKNGVISGIVLSLFIALLFPIVQWIISFVISPDYFKNAINHNLGSGYYKTFTDAKAQYNYANFVRQGILKFLSLGVICSAIIMLILRTEDKQDKNISL